MRGRPDYQSQIYYAIDIESWIPEDHPLRGVKSRADSVLRTMRTDLDRAYANVGRRSIPPEMLLKALLLQALYSIRSEEQLVEHVQMNLLYRWFLDLSLDASVWHPTTFTKNRERFEAHGLLRKFFDRIVEQALVEEWASDEHFTVDGTLVESYASNKSVRRKDSRAERVMDGSDDDDPSNPTVNFRGERRSNATHRSLTDPEARLARKSKGQEARLAHGFHVLMENRNGLVIDVAVSEANGRAEREQALAMIRRSKRRHALKPKTLTADKGYDAGPFLAELETAEGAVPLVPIPTTQSTAVESTRPSRRSCSYCAPTIRYRYRLPDKLRRRHAVTSSSSFFVAALTADAEIRWPQSCSTIFDTFRVETP